MAAADETAYVFVKRVSGSGTFALTSEHAGHCGNGLLDPGEICDPTVPSGAACCTASCLPSAPDTLCDDGNVCTTADHCLAGTCVGDALLCPLGSCKGGACVADEAGGASDGGDSGDGGDGGDGGAVTQSDGGAAGEPAGGRAGEPDSVTAGSAGTSERSPNANADTDTDTDTGCGCSAAGASQRTGSLLWIAAALGLFCVRRRRADNACQRTIQH